MRTGWWLIFCAALTASCAHRNDVVVAPDGQPALLLRCDSHAECLRQAGRKCTTGYEVIDREDQPGKTTYAVVGSTVVERRRRGVETMMIRCNAGVTTDEGGLQEARGPSNTPARGTTPMAPTTPAGPMPGASPYAQRPLRSSTSALLLFGGEGHRTFLGCLNCSEHDANSVHNKFGLHGSEFGQESIFNEFSQYGSPYSMHSACNEFASDPPVIVDRDGGYHGRLTLNQFREQTRDPETVAWLAGVCHH